MYISDEAIRPVLTYDKLIPAIRQALIDYSCSASQDLAEQSPSEQGPEISAALGFTSGRVNQPLRQVLRVKDSRGGSIGWFATMPVVAGEFLAVKTVTFFPGNSAQAENLPTHQATIALLDRATGQPLAVMDGRRITEMRTAAVSAVAAAALAAGARTLGVLGSGVQARAHIEALRHVLPAFRGAGQVQIWSRNPGKAQDLAAELGAKAAPIEVVAASDVVVTVTSAKEPVLLGKWLTADSLVLAVGAVGPELRELDDEAMRGCLVVESRQGARHESGDVLLSGARVFAEIGEVLAARTTAVPAGRVVFKSVGMAIEDLTGAALVWKALREI